MTISLPDPPLPAAAPPAAWAPPPRTDEPASRLLERLSAIGMALTGTLDLDSVFRTLRTTAGDLLGMEPTSTTAGCASVAARVPKVITWTTYRLT